MTYKYEYVQKNILLDDSTEYECKTYGNEYICVLPFVLIDHYHWLIDSPRIVRNKALIHFPVYHELLLFMNSCLPCCQ